jgi:ribosomal protein S3
MAMSKKLIKSIGSHQFNSSNSIIEYGFAKSFNKKGITGIKVWISFSPLLK